MIILAELYWVHEAYDLEAVREVREDLDVKSSANKISLLITRINMPRIIRRTIHYIPNTRIKVLLHPLIMVIRVNLCHQLIDFKPDQLRLLKVQQIRNLLVHLQNCPHVILISGADNNTGVAILRSQFP